MNSNFDDFETQQQCEEIYMEEFQQEIYMEELHPKNIRRKLHPNTNFDGERRRMALVYQAGIANIFEVNSFNLANFGRDAVRLYQGDFKTAEALAIGMGLAGCIVMTLACNQAGDIINEKWSDDLDNQPFSESFHPVFFTIGL